ncbi:ester cyclase [Aeoliella mucimassa]|uniref:SnoaL-like polyketide cyclase n=1 Tax=Aeoliella mucimassa TaxID=2527972 RepID=A0A518AMI3_9BACT|nr:ester cyclase [Aeoliella mucimassa]QDU55944.1 SnoaL-like polyketide cyclase [Aeoliella mucimassa]
MTEQEKLVTDYIETVWNTGNYQALESMTTSDFAYHLGGQPPRDRAGLQLFVTSCRRSFPDWRVAIESIVSTDDQVAVRWRGQVTHQGEFHGILATGRKVHVSGMNFYRLAGDKIAEEWEQTDSLDLLRQLGALP